MHLITGLILTALLRNKGKTKMRRPPSVVGAIETVHALDGRVRFRIPSLKRTETARRLVAERLARADGIESVEVGTHTGSVLVHYRPDKVSADLLFSALARMLGLEDEIDRPRQSLVGREITDIGHSINRAVHQRTGGIIDLWTALPLVFVALGIRRLLTGGLSGSQTGFAWFWWAFIMLFPPGRVGGD